MKLFYAASMEMREVFELLAPLRDVVGPTAEVITPEGISFEGPKQLGCGRVVERHRPCLPPVRQAPFLARRRETAANGLCVRS